ncbi:hypothetical protein LG202_15170 [Methylobacillus methanolivorans]
MFSLVIIFSSLIICSQLAADFLETCECVKGVLQYTHTLSLARTSISSQSGIFQLFAIVSYFTHNYNFMMGAIVLDEIELSQSD